MKTKSILDIQKKIVKGKAVVLSASQVSKLADKYNKEEIFEKVDVVTTATFAPMCSSGAFLNFGNLDLPIRMENITLNGVPASGGLAAVDTYIGATQQHPDNPKYGGANIISELVLGRDISLEATAKGTDCYPRKSIKTYFNLQDLNQAYLYNPRNAYQNYPAATNLSSNTIYTYMGKLLPKCGNITYSTSGELSPLLNDPKLKTIGIGTKISLCGTQGFVAWQGTQFDNQKEKNEFGIPTTNAATIAVIGDLKGMDSQFIKPIYIKNYGVSLFVGIGIPIPVIDLEIAQAVRIRNWQINTNICDYSQVGHPAICKINYQDLFSGKISLNGRIVKTTSFSPLSKAKKIANILQKHILNGKFSLTNPVQNFSEKTTHKPLKLRAKAC